jgi:hypothetical protein
MKIFLIIYLSFGFCLFLIAILSMTEEDKLSKWYKLKFCIFYFFIGPIYTIFLFSKWFIKDKLEERRNKNETHN